MSLRVSTTLRGLDELSQVAGARAQSDTPHVTRAGAVDRSGNHSTKIGPPTVEVPTTHKNYTLAEWLALPEWPNQRNTRAHADKLDNWGGFDRQNPTLGRHVAVIIYRKKEYRADGNSTALLNREGKCYLPPVIHSPVYDVANDELLGQKIYKSLNEKHGTKGAVDVMVSAVKLNKMGPKSDLISGGRATTGISVAANALRGVESNAGTPDMDETIRAWKPELAWVDGVLAKTGSVGKIANSTACIASMLMSRAKYSVHSRDPKIQAKVAHVEDFWDKFHTARGKGNTEDPCVRAWNYIVLHIKDSGGSRNKVYTMVEYVLGCVEAKGRPEKIMKRAIKSYLAD